MRLISLWIQNLRILEQVEISTDADLVVFSGLNGSGKTSLLEAIHLIGTGRSFRNHQIGDVVRQGCAALQVRAEVIGAQGGKSVAGIEKNRGGTTRFRINGEDVRTTSTLAYHLPMVAVTPDSQRLLTDGAQIRRKLLDWLMFHVEPEYNQVHQRYRRALRQRNAALQRNVAGSRQVWNEELGTTGQNLHALRAGQLHGALEMLSKVLAELLDIPVSVEYQPGWKTEADLTQLLARTWEQDRIRGYTGVGPQRADLRFTVSGSNARHVLSRGESKLLSVAILIGLSRLLAEKTGRKPLLLIDELASELDQQNRARFFTTLKATGSQIFVTTVSDELVSAADWKRILYYRVIRGKLQTVLK